MRYTEIVIYVRKGDKVTPVRVTRAHGFKTFRELDMAELFGNHTSWVADQIQRQTMRQTLRRNLTPMQYQEAA